MNHYATLGVPDDADADTIKAAYRRESRKAHPDRQGGDHQAMVAVNQAYETLSDPEKRARYDQTGQDAPAPPLDVQARTAIMSLFMQCMEQAGDEVELIEMVREQIRLNQQKLHAEIAKLQDRPAKLQARRRRLKYKGTERNFLDDLIEDQLRQNNERLARAQNGVSMLGRALELLVDFSYEPEVRAAQIVTITITVPGTGPWYRE
jgi:curved DNA-binding protein CbpA